MTIPLDPAVADDMRKRAQSVRDRMAAGANFTQSWSLSGKNAVVEPGRDVIARLLPRWDYANSMVLDPATNTRRPNPGYKPGRQFVVGYEHWWEQEGGRTTREWCPRTLDPAAPCPVCVAAVAMLASGVKEDREFGKRVQAREVFIFNAVIGDPRRVDAAGLADIRIISLVGTLFNGVSDIMTGGDKEQFARGDITHPREGYDLCFKRPVSGGGDRWSVQVAGAATPLYGPAQAAAFKGWVTRLVNLEDMLRKETKAPEVIYRAFYGKDPEPGEVAPVAGGGNGTSVPPDKPAETEALASAEPPISPDDEFMPPATSGRPVVPTAPPPARPAAAAARPPSAVRPPRR